MDRSSRTTILPRVLPYQTHGVPTVLRSGAYRLFFYSNEGNEPPHVHVRRERSLAKVWLDEVALAGAIGFSDVELRAIVRLVMSNRRALLVAWEQFHGST